MASNSLQYQQLKLKSGINRYLVGHMEVNNFASEMLRKFEVFWSQLEAGAEVFHMNLFTTTYDDATSVSVVTD